MWTRRQMARLLRRVSASGAYSPTFLATLSGGGAWCREARLLVASAALRGIALKEEVFLLSDVHDLQALLQALRARR